MQNSELLAQQGPSAATTTLASTAPTSSSVLCDRILTQTQVEGTVFIRLCLRPCPFHRRSIVDNALFIGLHVYASHPYWSSVLNALLLRNNGSWPAALMSTFYRTFLKQEFGWINFASLRNIISFPFAQRKIHQVCNNPQDQKTISVLKQEYWPSNHCLNLVTNWGLSEMEREKGIFWRGPKRYVSRRE